MMYLKYSCFSKYRKELMGIAILLVMIGHNTIEFPGFINNINSGIKMLAQAGVDLFFLFSGFGCFYSIHKNRNVLSFYKRRVQKIFPCYSKAQVVSYKSKLNFII